MTELMVMNKVRESFNKHFQGRCVPSNFYDELDLWLNSFDEPVPGTPGKGPPAGEGAHSIVLNCDGPEKGKDTRTHQQIVHDDILHSYAIRLARLEDKYEDLNTRFNDLCESVIKISTLSFGR